jgi:hypothetical protein
MMARTARFAHQADDATLGDGKRRAVDRAHGAGPGAVVDFQAVDFEDHRPRSLGMKTSS